MNETKDVALAGPPSMTPAFSMTPRTFDEAMKFAQLMSESDLVPVGYKGKPGNILVAIQKGVEVGLSPMAALETIAVINGRAAIWGDGLLALVQNHPAYEWIDESQSDDACGVCTIKRKGEEPYTQRFSLEDAKRAGLLEKPGTWRQYTKRMLQMRARGFALRDKFADALKGMIATEEALDIPTETVTATVVLPPEESLLDKLKKQAETAGSQSQRPPDSGESMEQPAIIPPAKTHETGLPKDDNAKPKATRKSPVKAEPPKAPPRDAAKEQAKATASTQAPPPNVVAYNDYLAGFEGIPPTDTDKAVDLMNAACKDVRLYDADYHKLEDYFYARYPTVKRPRKA